MPPEREGVRTGSLPSGWTFNPSALSHRRRLMVLAGGGLLISLYLALCQTGVIQHAWDPFFGEGTEKVLHSSLSRALPVPDAVLGACAYLVEIMLLAMGPDDRWKTRPRLTLLSGLLALSLAATSMGLLMVQSVLVRAWCTGCLLLAVLAFVLLQRSLSELVLCAHTLLIREDERPAGNPRANDAAVAWTEGTHCVWTLFLSGVLGAGILALSDLFAIEGVARFTFAFCGATLSAASIVAMADTARVLRFVNGALGGILFCWFLGQPLGEARWIIGSTGAAVIALCLHAGKADSSPPMFPGSPEAE